MLGVPRCSAGLPGAICGRGGKPIGQAPFASSAIPILSALTVWAAADFAPQVIWRKLFWNVGAVGRTIGSSF